VTTSQELRQAVVNLACSENQSTDASKYWQEVLPPNWTGPYPRHWCGAFTLWDLRIALGCAWYWEVKGILGAEHFGYLYHLPKTTSPDLGDICYLNAPYQHHAILTAIGKTPSGSEYVISQDGNQGLAPGECLEQWHERSHWSCFYSIESLIQRALEREQ